MNSTLKNDKNPNLTVKNSSLYKFELTTTLSYGIKRLKFVRHLTLQENKFFFFFFEVIHENKL